MILFALFFILFGVFPNSVSSVIVEGQKDMRRWIILLLPLCVALSQPRQIPKEERVGYSSITANDLSAHLHFLASQELEGRETAYRGQKVAARYIASVFQKLGLKAIGDNGSYFQSFDIFVRKVDPRSAIIVQTSGGKRNFQILNDYLTFANRDTVVGGGILFVGRMGKGLDSLTEEQTKGKILLAFQQKQTGPVTNTRGMRIPPTRLLPKNNGVLVIADKDGSGSLDSMRDNYRSRIEKGTLSTVQPRPSMGMGSQLTYSISWEMAETIVKGTGQSLSQLEESASNQQSAKPMLLNDISVQIESKMISEKVTSENVIGLLEGSDPKLKDEYVIITAHYDHLGVGANRVVNPGADDDGSGTIGVLELAEAFALNPVKPKRSIIFMPVTGEEKGLWGSSYYTQNPIIPLEKIISDLNIDMIGRIDPKYDSLSNPNYIYVIGSNRISTELDQILVKANKESENLILDYKYNDPKDPNNFYQRSDHYNFANKGIPIIFFFNGTHADYHRPTDTVDKINFAKMEKITRLIYHTAWKVANGQHPPKKDVKQASSK
ncbi:MAG: M28 family peptidase [bacterium]